MVPVAKKRLRSTPEKLKLLLSSASSTSSCSLHLSGVPSSPNKCTAQAAIHSSKKRSSLIWTRSLEPIVSGAESGTGAAKPSTDVQVHTLILGTHPSAKSLAAEGNVDSYSKPLSWKEILLRGGSGPQNYGHSRNCFWNICGSALQFSRSRTDYETQKAIFSSKGFALWDVVFECQHPQNSSLDSGIRKETMIVNRIPEFAKSHGIRRIVMAKTASSFFVHKNGFKRWLTEGLWSATGNTQFSFVIRNDGAAHTQIQETEKAFSRFASVNSASSSEIISLQSRNASSDGDMKRHIVVELVVLPSTSGASAMLRPAHKEKAWHIGCYGFHKPPPGYICAVCGRQDNHWTCDCTNNGGYSNWRQKCKKITAEENVEFEKFKSDSKNIGLTADQLLETFYHNKLKKNPDLFKYRWLA